MAEDFDDRTEAPTERRRAEARERGNVAKSVDLSAAALMLAAAAAVLALAPPIGRQLSEFTVAVLSSVSVRMDQGRALAISNETLAVLAASTAPVLLLAGLVTLGANLAQVGVLFAPDRSEEHTSELQSRENLVCR